MNKQIYDTVITRRARVIAAICCIVYILIQAFQEYVFRIIPEPGSVASELLQGGMKLHKWRSFLLLLSFFPMIYILTALVFSNIRRNVFLYSLALIGFLLFCFLEIGIRSVEYFYFQLQAPYDYSNSVTELAKSGIIDRFSLFQLIQGSLYFPLMLSQAISSIIILLIFPATPKINLLVKIAFGINSFRLIGRIAAMLFKVTWFNSFSGKLYLPFVIVIFGLLSYWFFYSRSSNYTDTEYLKLQ